jgi:hypothetical protein
VGPSHLLASYNWDDLTNRIMAIFESLVNALKALAVGDRVKVTLRPETGQFPNPLEGQITQKDASGNFLLQSEHGVIQVSAGDILSITRLPQQA